MSADNTHRIQARVDADVAQALGHVEDLRRYLEDLVRRRRREWQLAYRTLVGAGWTPAELHAACDALNGYGLLEEAAEFVGSSGIPLELHDAQRLSDVCAKWGVEPERWAVHVERLAGDPAEREALGQLAREFWLGNGELAERIRG